MRTLALTAFLACVTTAAQAVCAPTDLCTRTSNFNDITFGEYDYSGTVFIDEDFCVYVQNDNENAYELTLTGDGAGSAFTLSNGAQTIPYLVFVDDGTGNRAVTTGVPATYTSPETVSINCNSGASDSATLRIQIQNSNIDLATSGTYVGTVTVDAAPD